MLLTIDLEHSNMIASMTGYGRSDVKTSSQEITVEIRTLNNRFLDISVRLPKNLSQFEDEVRNLVKKHLVRGRVNISINVKESANDNNGSAKANLELAQHYLKQLKFLKKQLNLSGNIRVEHLLPFTDIFLMEEESEDLTGLWNELREAIEQALENVKKMRHDEGNELSLDLQKRVKLLDHNILEIEELAASRIDKERERLREKIENLTSIDAVGEDVNEGRIEMEIALLATRIDVTEECTRFKSHNKMFLEILESDGAIGRKLNFLLQEMTREANTIGSKAYDADISHLVVMIKEEVEKIREQVQNIE
ncbi:YicC family protein [candidate division KSB1 bacterium]|nr:YicC family protein [candidate division KSB1 bacterium]